MNNVIIICNEEHAITPGICALCERDHLREALQSVLDSAEIRSTARKGDGVTYGMDRWTIAQNAIDTARAALAKLRESA